MKRPAGAAKFPRRSSRRAISSPAEPAAEPGELPAGPVEHGARLGRRTGVRPHHHRRSLQVLQGCPREGRAEVRGTGLADGVRPLLPGGQSLVLKKPSRYCEPVAADGSSVGFPASKLVCYGVKLPTGTKFAKTLVSTNNPDYGTDVLLATSMSELCLPASVAP